MKIIANNKYKKHDGTFRVVTSNNNSDYAHVINSKGIIFRIMNDLSLEKVGLMPNGFFPSYNKLSFHPQKNVVTFLNNNGELFVSEFSGNLLFTNNDRFETVCFSRSGIHIWSIMRKDSENLIINVMDSLTGELVSQLDFVDELYDSRVTLTDIPNSDKMIMELAAGQDGVSVYEMAILDSDIEAKEMFPNNSYISPFWSPSGNRFLTLENDDQAYAIFTYPDLEPLKKERPFEDRVEELDDEDVEELQPGYSMVVIDDNKAIVQSLADYQYYTYDLNAMLRLEKIRFEGLGEELAESLVNLHRIDDKLIFNTDDRNEPGYMILINTRKGT